MSPPLSLRFTSRSPADTQGLGCRLGELAEPGDVLLLVGGLGTGKTLLVQGLARGLGIPGYVASPSFVLVREYQGRLPLYHIDLYRLEGAEVAELGLEDYLYGEGVSAVEWADRAPAVLPAEHLLIEMGFLSPRQRRLRLQARGQCYRSRIAQLKQFIRAEFFPGLRKGVA